MRPGFTVTELLVVLAITLVLATISIPLLRPPAGHELKGFLTTLEHTCHWLQQRALATGQPHQLIIDQATKTISYQAGPTKRTVKLPAQLDFGSLPQAKGPPSDPKHQIIQIVTFPKTTSATVSQPGIMFYPDGAISPGALYLIDKAAGCMGALTCGVSQVSWIRVYYYHEPLWLLATS